MCITPHKANVRCNEQVTPSLGPIMTCVLNFLSHYEIITNDSPINVISCLSAILLYKLLSEGKASVLKFSSGYTFQLGKGVPGNELLFFVCTEVKERVI